MSRPAKKDKTLAMGVFLRTKTALYQVVENGVASNSEVRALSEKLLCNLEQLLAVCEELGHYYKSWSEIDKMAALDVEMDNFVEDFRVAEQAASAYCLNRSRANSSMTQQDNVTAICVNSEQENTGLKQKQDPFQELNKDFENTKAAIEQQQFEIEMEEAQLRASVAEQKVEQLRMELDEVKL